MYIPCKVAHTKALVMLNIATFVVLIYFAKTFVNTMKSGPYKGSRDVYSIKHTNNIPYNHMYIGDSLELDNYHLF